MKHLINWVEIPAADLGRARTFYSAILGVLDFQEADLEGSKYAIFPTENKFNCGALVQGEYHKPSTDGVVIYLDGGPDMNGILDAVEAAGGQVVMPKTYTGKDAGYVGMFIDTEGNRIGLQHA